MREILAAGGGRENPWWITAYQCCIKTYLSLGYHQQVLDCLEDGMSFDQWIYTFCKKENVRTHNEFKFSVVERNFANFVDWLADEGRIEVRREFCAKHYFRRDA